jgi:hypothetical protein
MKIRRNYANVLTVGAQASSQEREPEVCRLGRF